VAPRIARTEHEGRKQVPPHRFKGANPKLSAEAVEELRTAARRFGRGAAAAKRNLLRACSAATIDEPRTLLAYHDCLLFLLAYPQTPDLRAEADRELSRVSVEARRLAQRGPLDRWVLEDSGVAWSETSPTLSYPIARWLVERFPHQVELASFADDGQPLRTILQLCLPTLEEGILSRDRPADDLLEHLAGDFRGSKLEWLLDQLARASCAEEIREHLFESLRAFIRIRLMDGPLSRTFARGLPREAFYHRGELHHAVHPNALIVEQLPPRRKLTVRDRRHLIEVARALLSGLGRETEAIRWCLPEAVECFDLDRGLSVALYPMAPGRRLPLDTHVGFMLFKNAMPIAYGGGWPFLGLCRIGIHVFEPYRGAESAYAMCQVMRVYHHRFGCDRFLAEPSQFGEGEREGLTSGAFWFYHRLGFRPVDERVAKLVDAEVGRRKGGDRRRTPVGLLRRLTRSNLELVLPGGEGPAARCDPADLSLAVTAWIGSRFEGDRGRAEREALESVKAGLGVVGMERWPEPERRSFRSLCLLLAMVPGLDRWPAADRRKAIAILRAKGAPGEDTYFDLMRRHRRFREAMVKIAAGIN
jgi:hypothetical protein